MSILIKGMEMPKNGETITITICDDGIVFEERKEPGSVFKAISVPERRRITNANRVRQMTDEELATLFTGCPIPGEVCNRSGCRGCFLEWLREEVSE